MSNRYKVSIFVMVALFISIATLLKYDALVFFDTYVYEFVIRFQSDRLTFFFRQITRLANGESVIIISILLLLVKQKIGVFCLLNIIGNTILNQGLKMMFVRVRPGILPLVNVGGYSFPSGHAMMSMAFYGLLIYFVYQSSLAKNIKIGLCCLFGVIILLVGISRIYLGVHFASDILGGYLVSLIYLLIIIFLIKKNTPILKSK